MSNSAGMVSANVRMPKPLLEQLKRLAASQERTFQATCIRALRSGLALEEEQARRAEEAAGVTEPPHWEARK